jgi:hypothetical protein
MHTETDLRSLFDHISRERGYQSRLSKRNVRTVSVSTNPPVCDKKITKAISEIEDLRISYFPVYDLNLYNLMRYIIL